MLGSGLLFLRLLWRCGVVGVEGTLFLSGCVRVLVVACLLAEGEGRRGSLSCDGGGCACYRLLHERSTFVCLSAHGHAPCLAGP